MTRTSKRTMRVLVVLSLLALSVVGCAACVTAWLSDPRPTGDAGDEAERLADAMLAALDSDAWERTGAVRFQMRGGHPQILWDRARGFVEVRFDDERRVLLDLASRRALAWRGETPARGDDVRELADDAYRYFANDTFWLAAPFKVRDPGTRRSVVELDGARQLLVEYASGGVTPGDAYLWRLDEDGRPLAWRMWVKIVPIGGVEVAWSDWTTLPTGAVVARRRAWRVPGELAFDITPIEAATTLAELVGPADPFAPLVDELSRPPRASP